ncbi:MAG: HU family DNA-binding protein [Paramuribaculum sp.]|nr:HU family DNA-binding protein [Bacteroidales bacterium]MDE6249284.1 HU family DNA-binding protein [Paramuribaculum sp.]MDE7449751.1 HU family DNA-binding protein [Paramuribaculum sp.]
MNDHTLINGVSEKLDITSEEAQRLLAATVDAIRDCCMNLDAVAVPGFGTIQPVKHDEEIRTDLSTGQKMLFPPCIEVEFKSSVVLRKKLAQ